MKLACGSAAMTNTTSVDRASSGALALLFIVSTAGTIAWCASMSAMGGMPMPGGWTMSMAWMRMPGQAWPAAAASFIGMWLVMMVSMMLPSLAPRLWGYREAIDSRGEKRKAWLTIVVAASYFFVWTQFGIAIYPLGLALAAAEMRHEALARLVPIALGVLILIAGAVQFTAWKQLHLACCRETPGHCTLPADAGTGWSHGRRLGLQCVFCCANLTAVML